MNMKYALKSEDTEQVNVIQWAQWNVHKYPELKWLYHCPNGGSRNKQEAVKLKQMGVKAGVSDLNLPYPKGIYHGLYIEMKYENNKQQNSQKEFLSDMAAAGHFVATCYSAEEAIKIIEEYCKLNTGLDAETEEMEEDTEENTHKAAGHQERVGQLMSIPNNSILKNGKISKTKPVNKQASTTSAICID